MPGQAPPGSVPPPSSAPPPSSVRPPSAPVSSIPPSGSARPSAIRTVTDLSAPVLPGSFIPTGARGIVRQASSATSIPPPASVPPGTSATATQPPTFSPQECLDRASRRDHSQRSKRPKLTSRSKISRTTGANRYKHDYGVCRQIPIGTSTRRAASEDLQLDRVFRPETLEDFRLV